jgi:hypothetical protein
MDNRRIHDRALAYEQTALGEQRVDFCEERRCELVAFKQPPKAQNRRLVWDDVRVAGDAGKSPHQQRVVQRLLRSWIRQVVPLLQAVDTQHAFQRNRRATAGLIRLRIVRLDQRTEPGPGHDLIHVGQKLLASRLLALIEIACHRQRRLLHVASVTGGRLLQRTTGRYVDDELRFCRVSLGLISNSLMVGPA